MTKKVVQSKTKIGAVIGGVAIVVGTGLSYFEGAMDGATAIKTIGLGIGVILFGIGLRDALPDSPN